MRSINVLQDQMMDADKIQQLLSELTAEEQAQFQQILQHLQAVGGDMSALSEQDSSLMAKLASGHYQAAPEENAQPNQDPEAKAYGLVMDKEDIIADYSATVTDEPEETEQPKAPVESPNSTDFGQYVVDQIKTLCEGGSSLADAIRYAFHNKYIPMPLKDDSVCLTIYNRYQSEIDALNQKLESFDSMQDPDPKLVVGLAWFSMLFQCYQYIEAHGDLH